MRSLSANAATEVATKQGTEPAIILDIQWSDGGSFQRYGDIAIPTERVSGTIQEISGLDNVITISGVSQGVSGDSQQLSVVLADVDGSIKQILDNTDIHKQPVLVYQWFKGMDFADRFLLFKGQVSSPIEWHEGDRTVRFDVINQIEDVEYGFSIEEGNFRFASDEMVGKAWPLCFGTPRNVPALQTRSPYSGILKQGFGINDFTLEKKLEQLRNTCCPLVFKGFSIRLTAGGQQAFPVYQQEPGCYCRRIAQIEQWEQEIALQKANTIEIGSSITIIGGADFPQLQNLWILVCGAAKLYGYFNGDQFKVLKFKHPQKDELTVPPVKTSSVCIARASSSLGATPTGGTYASRDQVLFNITECGEEEGETQGQNWDYLATFPTADFFWAEPGCEVVLESDTELAYIANILPSTILRVAAFRTFESSGIKQLVTVPTDYYTTRVSDFNGYMVTEVVMDKPLSYRGEGYEDDIYVTLTSSVGPNTVDILEWLIGMYTSFNIDSTSFDAVKATLGDKYPMDFPLLKRGNILQLLKDIAFQQRCALVLRNDTFYLIYLSEEPSADFSISESDILPESFILTHTETEELVTKFVALWKKDHHIDDPNKVILRYNIPRYGTQEQEFDFFTFKHYSLVEKSATFWLIRMANTWRKIRCKTPITKLASEVFDIADVTLPDFSPSTVKCIVEQATYDSNTHEIDFVLWTPVRSGETEPYVFAWPANIDVTDIYPQIEDWEQGKAGGTGPNVDVEPPSSHPLAEPQGFTASFKKQTNCNPLNGTVLGTFGNESCRKDHGDSQPSDLDDTAPSDDNPGEGEGNIISSKNPVGEAPEWIQNQFTTATDAEARNNESTNNNNVNAGDGGGGDDDVDPYEDLPNEPENTECYAVVRVCTGEVDRVLQGEEIKTEEGECGIPIWPVINVEGQCSYLYLDSIDAAKEVSDALNQAAQDGCVGQYAIIGPFTGYLASLSSWGPMCEEPTEDPRILAAQPSGDPDNWDQTKELLGGIL